MAVPKGRPGLTMLAALLGLFVVLLDVTVVNVALPTIRGELNASFTDLEWVANAYLLALAVLIVTAGRVGDILGHRRVYAGGVLLFLTGSLLCGAADTMTVLHAGRVVQGLGGAVVVPLSLAVIYAGFEGRARSLGIMLWGAAGGLATALGPLIGGLLVDHFGWQWIFLINLPLGVLVVIAALLGIGDSGRPASAGRVSFDLPGLVTAGATLLCLNLALINGPHWGWSSGGVLALFGGALLGLALFVLVERRAVNPIVNLSWLRRPSFGGSVLAGLLLGTGMFSIIFYLSIYLQNGLGFSAQQTGLRLLPMTLVLILGAPLGGRLATLLGARNVLAGTFVLMAVGIALLARLDPQGDRDSWTTLLPGMLITGLCLGAVMPIISELTVAAGPQDQIGVVSSVGAMFRQVGNSVGIAVMGALLTARINDVSGGLTGDQANSNQVTRLHQEAISYGVRDMAWFAAAVTLAAALVVLLSIRGRPTEAEERALPTERPVMAGGH
ncbi:MFS transporter [Kitasatospora sp. P5_F3]